MNTTVPADPRRRQRSIAVVSITWLVGLVSFYFLQGFPREMEALVTASPQLAFEKLNPAHNALRGVTLFSAMALACLPGYESFSVSHWAVAPPAWRVMGEMRVRTGRQATVVAVFFLFLSWQSLQIPC
jgi:hypothetical protein